MFFVKIKKVFGEATRAFAPLATVKLRRISHRTGATAPNIQRCIF